MDIIFQKKKDRDICNENLSLRKKYKGNPRRAKEIRKRLDELRDSDTLHVMRLLPHAHCHELKCNRKGQLAVNLDKGFRMVFEPANEPVPHKPDGGLDWQSVTAVRILKLDEDYHG